MMNMLTLPFMQTALAASLLIGLICSFIGVYIVLKRIVFVGAAIANISTAGIAFAILMGFNPELFSLFCRSRSSFVFYQCQKRTEKNTCKSIIGMPTVFPLPLEYSLWQRVPAANLMFFHLFSEISLQ